MEISFSRFRIYRECPWKYRLQFVEGRRPTLDPSASLGVSLHRALERYHRGGEPEWQALADAYDLEFVRSGYPDASTRAQWSAKGLRMLKRYYESELERRTEILGNEREFVFPVGAHAARGMIDRLDRHPDGKIELIDYKTSIGGLPDAALDLQLRFYALGAKKGLGLTPDLLTVHYLEAGERVTKPYDPSGEAELEREIGVVAEKIGAGAFPPDTSFCPRCVFRRECAFSAAKA